MKEKFHLNIGDEIKVTPDDCVGTKDKISISYPHIVKDLEKGDCIYVNDGIVKLVVKEKGSNELTCTVEAPGEVSDHKGCNIPKGNLSIELPTPKDKEDLEFIAKLNPEFVATSFVETAEDVNKVRAYLKKFGNDQIKIVSKIERPEALKHIDEIIEASDAIMVARGDLGVEIPVHEVPVAQKDIVKRCNQAGKTVIVATQMLESMAEASRPTRAEASDVFNAVLDGADSVMLSAETSVGKYPVQTVKCMDQIVENAEKYLALGSPDQFDASKNSLPQAIGNSAFHTVQHLLSANYNVKVICITTDGLSVQMVSKFRPGVPIIALTTNLRVARELNMTWGTRTVFMNEIPGKDLEEKSVEAVKKVHEMGIVQKSDHVVIVADSVSKKVNHGVWMGIYVVSEILD